MANYTIDPNTGINVPTVGVDPGPDYATNISAALTKLASLTHTGASLSDGLQIPSAGLNINADLSFQSHNLTSLRSFRLNSQGSTLSGAGDVLCMYVNGNDLYYNNGSGVAIRLTAGSSPAATISSSYVEVAITGNLTILSTDTTTYVKADSTSTSIIVTLPAANAVAAGRFYLVKDAKAQSQTHNITIAPAGGDTIDGAANWVIADNYALAGVVSDGVSNWNLLLFDRKIYFAGETLKLTNGATLQSDATSPITAGYTLDVTGATTLRSTVDVTGAANFRSTVSFDKAVSNPILCQADLPTNNLTGQNLTVHAQNETGTTSVGGALILASGTGTTNAGSVQVRTGSTVNTTFGLTSVTFNQPSVIFDKSITPGISQTTLTADTAPQNITISPQAPYSAASGSNRIPGSLNVSLAAPTNGGTTRGNLNILTDGNQLLAIFGDSSGNAYWNANSSGGQATYFQSNGVTKFEINNTGISFYGGTPVAQASRAGQLTDNTGGSVTSTLAAGITDTVAKNAIASLCAKVNALELLIHNSGLSA